MDEALEETRRIVESESTRPLFEAAFEYRRVLVRTDVLERLPDGGWRLVEVKSATRLAERFIVDVAVQLRTLRGAGLDGRDAAVLILDALSHAVDMHEGQVAREGQWRATVVKEKFGTLRISSTGGDARTSALEHFALLMSARTCQHCGAPGEPRRFGEKEFPPQWDATLCDACCAAEVAGRYGISSDDRH